MKKITNIKLQDYGKSEEVLGLVQDERSMVNTIHKRQSYWVGHLLRRNSLLTEILEEKCKRKNERKTKAKTFR